VVATLVTLGIGWEVIFSRYLENEQFLLTEDFQGTLSRVWSSVKITFCLYARNSSRKAEQIFLESDIRELYESLSNRFSFGLNLT